MKYIWIVFFGLSIYYIVKYLNSNKIINNKDSVKLYGYVVDNKIGTIQSGICVYYPVYEYEFNGEKRQYVSVCNQFKPSAIGSKGVLYYNMAKSEIVEVALPIVNMALAILFAGAAMVILNFAA